MIRPALTLLSALTVLTGLVYPLAVTGAAQAAFPWRANGSLIPEGGPPRGSRLVGQPFDDPRYFWGRPSATAPFPCNAASSGASNLAPSNPALADTVKARVAALRLADPGNSRPVPIDLVTASGSGLDPHISPSAAAFQAGRVARVRGLPEAAVRDLVARHIEGRTLFLLGEPRANVLELNLALDTMR
jgi:K+-transporting ATPase ATPase C chain